MNDIQIDKTLYRIIQGRLRFKRDGLVLYIQEPTKELMYESYEIYDDAYDLAYKRGNYIKPEVLQILIEQDLWTPLDDKEAKEYEKKVEDKKLEAYQNFTKERELFRIKREIRHLEKLWGRAVSKKTVYDSVTCEWAAELSRVNWLLEQTCFYPDGTKYDWKDMSIMDMAGYYGTQSIAAAMYRKIARSASWRSMWSSGKDTSLFGRPSCEYTKDQLTLCTYSKMYDNVYEHPDSPTEKVIQDDDCLDGWFIFQKRKREKEKKKSEVQGLIKNQKIANSGEIFVMAQDENEASNVYDINNPHARGIIRNREHQIEAADGEHVKQGDFADIQLENANLRRQNFVQHVRGK